jgi:hypothetical protein
MLVGGISRGSAPAPGLAEHRRGNAANEGRSWGHARCLSHYRGWVNLRVLVARILRAFARDRTAEMVSREGREGQEGAKEVDQIRIRTMPVMMRKAAAQRIGPILSFSMTTAISMAKRMLVSRRAATSASGAWVKAQIAIQ